MRRRALLVVLLAPLPAQAAEAVFPPGSAVGLVPPPGMRPADRFAGFQDDGAHGSILIAELPAEAFAAVSKLDDAALQQRQGITVARRRTVPVPGAQAVLLSGTQVRDGARYRKWLLVAGTSALTALVAMQVPEAAGSAYPDRVAEAALASVAFRPVPPLQARLDALPFTVGDLAGFRVSRTMLGSGLILTDGPLDTMRDAEQPVMVVVLNPPSSAGKGAQDALARRALATARLRDPVILRVEAFSLRGDDWHLIEATGADAGTGRAHYAMQVLRFGRSGLMQALGITREEMREAVAPRFRAAAVSIDLRV